MQAIRGRDTKPELELRRRLWSAGLRYRVDARPVPVLRRRADVVFRRARVAVFVDGCFWHGCPEHGHAVGVNETYWSAKLARNIARDRDTDQQLAAAGWVVVRVWEHEEPAEAARAIEETVRSRRELHGKRLT